MRVKLIHSFQIHQDHKTGSDLYVHNDNISTTPRLCWFAESGAVRLLCEQMLRHPRISKIKAAILWLSSSHVRQGQACQPGTFALCSVSPPQQLRRGNLSKVNHVVGAENEGKVERMTGHGALTGWFVVNACLRPYSTSFRPLLRRNADTSL